MQIRNAVISDLYSNKTIKHKYLRQWSADDWLCLGNGLPHGGLAVREAIRWCVYVNSIQFHSIQFNSIQRSALRHTYTYIPGNWQGLWMELRERRELLMAPTSKCEGHDSPASALTTLPRHRSYPPFPKVPFHLCVPILLERTSESPTICKLLKWDSGLKGSSKAFKIPFQAISSTSADENVCCVTNIESAFLNSNHLDVNNTAECSFSQNLSQHDHIC